MSKHFLEIFLRKIPPRSIALLKTEIDWELKKNIYLYPFSLFWDSPLGIAESNSWMRWRGGLKEAIPLAPFPWILFRIEFMGMLGRSPGSPRHLVRYFDITLFCLDHRKKPEDKQIFYLWEKLEIILVLEKNRTDIISVLRI